MRKFKMKAKPKRKLPTEAQYLIFIKELETNADFFEQHTACGSNNIWEPIVNTMNNADGPINNVEQWRIILKRWKFTTRQKFRSIDYNKPGALNIFTPVQQRLLLALGNLDVNTCRGCFQKNTSNTTCKWYPLFKDMANLTSLSDKAKIYSKITHFQISKSDMLPRWLCIECWKICKDWYEFLKQCKGCENVCDDNGIDEDDDSDIKFHGAATENNYEHLIKTEYEILDKNPLIKKNQNANSTGNKNKKDGHILIKQESENFLSTSNLDTTFDPLESIYVKQESSPVTIEPVGTNKLEVPLIGIAKSCEIICNDLESKSAILGELEQTSDREIKEEKEEEERLDNSEFEIIQYNDNQEEADQSNENIFSKECEIVLMPLTIETINKNHKIKKNRKKEFECFDCKMTFIKLTMLKLHILSHGPRDSNRKHICQICGSAFTAAYRLRRHLKRHDPSSRCNCLDCGKKFCTAADLASHEKRYLGKAGHPYPHEKPHKCAICPKTFKKLSDFDDHQEVHKAQITVPPVHFCEICNKMYKTRKSLRDHGYTCHKNLEKKYLCSECGKSFIKPNLLLSHQRTHDPSAELFPCLKCNKKFSTPLLLRAHSRTHTELRPFLCSTCKKSFKTNSHLQTHNRVHTGARPFSCDICNMTFAYSDVLKRHKKKHADMEY